MSVCLSRYAFGRASTYRAETWHGGRVWRVGGNCQLFVATRQVKGHLEVNLFRNALRPPNSVTVSQGQPEVKLLRNAVWPPNLVGRTLDQSVTHCWVSGHAGVSQGQPEVKFFRNALWPPNLAERTPDQSVMHRWAKDHAGVSWGQPEDNCLEMRNAIKGSQCYKALCSCRCSSVSITNNGG